MGRVGGMSSLCFFLCCLEIVGVDGISEDAELYRKVVAENLILFIILLK